MRRVTRILFSLEVRRQKSEARILCGSIRTRALAGLLLAPGFWLLISRRFLAGYQGRSPWLVSVAKLLNPPFWTWTSTWTWTWTSNDNLRSGKCYACKAYFGQGRPRPRRGPSPRGSLGFSMQQPVSRQKLVKHHSVHCANYTKAVRLIRGFVLFSDVRKRESILEI